MTVIHHWADHRVSADNRVDSSWPSQRSQHAMKPDIRSESRFLSTPCAFDAPVGEGGVPSEYCYNVWYGKNRMVSLPEGGKI